MATPRDWSSRELKMSVVVTVTVLAVLSSVASVPVERRSASPCLYGSKRDTSFPEDDVSKPISKRQPPMCFTSLTDCLIYTITNGGNIDKCKRKLTQDNSTYWDYSKRHLRDVPVDENLDVSKKAADDVNEVVVSGDDRPERFLGNHKDVVHGEKEKREVSRNDGVLDLDHRLKRGKDSPEI